MNIYSIILVIIIKLLSPSIYSAKIEFVASVLQLLLLIDFLTSNFHLKSTIVWLFSGYFHIILGLGSLEDSILSFFTSKAYIHLIKTYPIMIFRLFVYDHEIMITHVHLATEVTRFSLICYFNLAVLWYLIFKKMLMMYILKTYRLIKKSAVTAHKGLIIVEFYPRALYLHDRNFELLT